MNTGDVLKACGNNEAPQPCCHGAGARLPPLGYDGYSTGGKLQLARVHVEFPKGNLLQLQPRLSERVVQSMAMESLAVLGRCSLSKGEAGFSLSVYLPTYFSLSWDAPAPTRARVLWHGSRHKQQALESPSKKLLGPRRSRRRTAAHRHQKNTCPAAPTVSNTLARLASKQPNGPAMAGREAKRRRWQSSLEAPAAASCGPQSLLELASAGLKGINGKLRGKRKIHLEVLVLVEGILAQAPGALAPSGRAGPCSRLGCSKGGIGRR